ncbi:MAG: DUF885 family protein [Acidobacteriota bacterium]|nr:DUF885 family protein [Acidobacteriota bacterium]
MMRWLVWVCLAAPFFGFSAGSDDVSAAALTRASDNVMEPLVRRFSTDLHDLNEFYDMPMSSVYLERLGRFMDEWRAVLDKVDFESLNQSGRIDWILLRNKLTNESLRLAERAKREEEVKTVIPFAVTMAALEENRRVMKPLDPRQAAEHLDTMKRQLDEVSAELADRLKKSEDEISKPLVRRALVTLGQLRGPFRQWQSFYQGYDPVFTWWTAKPLAAFQESLKKYSQFLSTKVLKQKPGQAPPIVGDPIGSEAFRDELNYQMIPYTPEELIEIGYKELAWCKAEMKKAAGEMGLGEDWQAAMEKTRQDHVTPGQQDESIYAMALEAVDFLEKNELVTIPALAKEIWEVRMMSLRSQDFTPFFYYSERHIAVAYPTEEMDHARKEMSLRANNKHFSRAVVHHELIPGHHLQYYMNSRYNTHRKPFRTSFWGEGWALYWEMLLWDLNFQKSPMNKMGMLFWRAHRCARIIVSLSFHLERMKPDEMIDFLIDEVGHERDSATAEVRRFVESPHYGPLYQCAYMVGGLQFRALHKELVQSGKMTDREFHDAILREGRIPVEMVRALLTNQKLTKDFTTRWRFYEK